ncbi:Peptidyl-prolyl cis-trans isomerase CWC27 like protein [Eufriesea mexicana]|uniref:Peptidyl-prolyl cis-trans isomerase n=1 Tax=Eufriesea mexicana TaxID=516756 RepID=A0A310SBC3_9HYME|nr:Peptidyl-prolyl cis-trans isomerase CWC27 like protein [Eufriesea mexicana]
MLKPDLSFVSTRTVEDSDAKEYGFWDDTIFHRIIKGFITQGGDPTGIGDGGKIYGGAFKDEFCTRLRSCGQGLIAMANAGKDDNGSQFFFTLGSTSELQNKHTIFGKVAGGTIYNMLELEEALVDETDRPLYPPKMRKTEILNNPFPDIIPRIIVQESEEVKNSSKTKTTGLNSQPAVEPPGPPNKEWNEDRISD